MKPKHFMIAFILINLIIVSDIQFVTSHAIADEAPAAAFIEMSTTDRSQEPSSTFSPVVPIGYNFPIALDKGDTIQGKPAIGFDGTNFFAVWADLSNYNIYGARVAPDGTVLDPNAISISTSLNELARQPSVGYDGVNFFVVWCATRSGSSEVYGARVRTDGVVLDPQGIKLTTGGGALDRMPGIAFDGTNYLVVWRTGAATIRAARITTAGLNLDAPAGFSVITLGISKYPAVAFDGVNYMVVWHKTRPSTEDDIYGARVTIDGQVLDPEGFIICDAPMSQNYPTIAFNGTNYLVVWFDWRPNADEYHGSAYGARVSPNGTVMDVPAFKIAGRVYGQVPVQVIYDGTEWFVVYMEQKENFVKFRLTDVFGFRISADGQVVNQQGIPISTSFGNQFGPAVGYGGGGYLVAWGDGFRYSGSAIYGQILQRQPSASSSIHEPEATIGGDSIIQASDIVSNTWAPEVTPLSISGNTGLAFSATNSYAFGHKENAHYVGTQWQSEAMYSLGNIYGSWANGPDDIWVSGWCDGFSHFDGQSWSELGCFSDFWHLASAVWGSDSKNLWATADNGKLLQYDGINHWALQSSGVPLDLGDLWGTSASNIYAVGERSTILHYAGKTWNVEPVTATIQTLNAVWGSGPDDIFAVGDWGTILHYDGMTWDLQDSGTYEHLFDVWGFGDSEVYAVGFEGTILHFDGYNWHSDISGTGQDLLAVWGVVDLGDKSKTLWASGFGNVVLKKTIPITVFNVYLPVVVGQ